MKRMNSREDIRPRLSSRAKRKDGFAVLSRMASVILSILQEIFDESAYQRFLEKSRLESSPKAYAIFRQETEHAQSRRPRCC